MRVFNAVLIDKSLRADNKKLQKQLASELRKNLRISGSAISSRELNTFIILSGEKSLKGEFNPKMIEKIEKGNLYKRFKDYYVNNESKLQRYLRNKQELAETSQIIKDFIKEINPKLTQKFDEQLKKIRSDLPTQYCEIQSKSMITLWDLAENQEYRFVLPGFNSTVLTGSTNETKINVEELIDKFIIINFFAIFLKPTLDRLKELDYVLERLKQEVEVTHYKTTNQKLQKKLELFFRILAAKLSALQDIDKHISRIFDLYEVPRTLLSPYHFGNDSMDFNTLLAGMASEIKSGKKLLFEVHNKIQRCQICLREYLDDRRNGIVTIDSINEFKKSLTAMSELSIDLFVEAELLKMWTDYFGTDVPYFSFNTRHIKKLETTKVADDTILAVRGLTKDYRLGRTTVYALRGVTLDFKEGEFVAIIGDSGAGKTTFLNCIAGLDTPDYGTVLFRGENLHEMSDSAKSKARLLEMGFIFQSYALIPHFTTRENIALPADLAGLSKDLRERIEQLLKGVGIEQQSNQYPAQLSGGQMQRVAIARALTNRPAIIFADEPTGDLDSETGKQVMNLLKKFHEETKTTIIIITHEQDIADYAERQVRMEDGIIKKIS